VAPLPSAVDTASQCCTLVRAVFRRDPRLSPSLEFALCSEFFGFFPPSASHSVSKHERLFDVRRIEAPTECNQAPFVVRTRVANSACFQQTLLHHWSTYTASSFRRKVGFSGNACPGRGRVRPHLVPPPLLSPPPLQRQRRPASARSGKCPKVLLSLLAPQRHATRSAARIRERSEVAASASEVPTVVPANEVPSQSAGRGREWRKQQRRQTQLPIANRSGSRESPLVHCWPLLSQQALSLPPLPPNPVVHPCQRQRAAVAKATNSPRPVGSATPAAPAMDAAPDVAASSPPPPSRAVNHPSGRSLTGAYMSRSGRGFYKINPRGPESESPDTIGAYW